MRVDSFFFFLSTNAVLRFAYRPLASYFCFQETGLHSSEVEFAYEEEPCIEDIQAGEYGGDPCEVQDRVAKSD